MAAILENISQLERRVNLSLAPTEIQSEIQNRLKHLARKVKMDGFRPGKVPLKVVAQQYEDQVRREVLGDALQKQFGDVIREQNLKVAGYPRFEVREAQDAQPFEYSATFEIYPEVAVGDLSQATLHRVTTTVSDAEVDSTLEIMRKQRATFTTVERAAASGDRVTVDFSGRIDGQPFEGGQAQGMHAILGEGRLLPDFENQIIGLAPGGNKTFELRFPDDYHGKEVAGKTATFELQVTGVAAAQLPPLDAEFAKLLGITDGNLDKMRGEIRANLEREVKQRIQSRLKEQVMQALVDATKVEVPKSLVDLEIQRLTAAARQDLEGRGIKTEGLPFPRDIFAAQAQRRVTLGLILAEVVKTHSLQAKAEQVRTMVEEQAQSYEQPEQVVKWVYQSPERLREVESAVVEDNIVEWALRTAKVEDKAVAFEALMAQGNKGKQS